MSQISEVYRRILLLANEHKADLDMPVRLMAGHAWTGGGAPYFFDAAMTQRNALQSALATALSYIAGECARRNEPVQNSFETGPAITTSPAAHSPFQGVDVAAMNSLTTTLVEVGDQLPALGAQLRAALT